MSDILEAPEPQSETNPKTKQPKKKNR